MKIWPLVSRQSGSAMKFFRGLFSWMWGRSRHAAVYNMKSAPVIFHESKQTWGSLDLRERGSRDASIKAAAGSASSATPNYCFSKRAGSSLARPSGKNTCFVCGDRVFGNDSRKNESCDSNQWLERRRRATLFKTSLTSGKYHNTV